MEFQVVQFISDFRAAAGEFVVQSDSKLRPGLRLSCLVHIIWMRLLDGGLNKVSGMELHAE